MICRKLYFTLFILFTTQIVWSQSQKPEIFFTFDSADWDKPLVTKQYLMVDGFVLKVARTDTVEKKQFEFIRLNDKTYYYTETDSMGTVLAEGKALLDKKPFTEFKFRILDSNGNVKGYQNTAYVKFSKVGFWVERVAEKLLRHGNYVADKKEGKWVYYTDNVWSFIEKYEYYHAGEITAGESNNQLEKSLAGIAASIIGQWGIPREKMMTNNDSLIYFERIKAAKSGSYAGYLSLQANGNCQLKTKSHHNTATHNGTWKIKGIDKVVVISIPKLQVIIIIDFISTDSISGFVETTQ